MTRIPFYANLSPFTGYYRALENIVTELSKMGYEPTIRPTVVSEMFGAKLSAEMRSRIVGRAQPETFQILLHPPDLAPSPDKINIAYTMTEATRLPELSVDYMNMADLVIVPSQWGASCMSAQGVTTCLRVVPLGCTPRYEPMLKRDKFIFACAGRLAHGGTRKGIEAVIECFKLAFPAGYENVELKVKVFPDCKLVVEDDPRIKVTRAYLTDAQMHRWMADANCFVSAAKGEGFGLHQIEAMAMGRPVIAPIYGGLAEFMNVHNSFPVRFTHTPADGYYEGLGNLISVDEWEMAKIMAEVAEKPDEVEQRGLIAFQDVRHLTWANTARQLLSVLEESGAL